MRLNGERKDNSRKILERMKKFSRNCVGDYSLDFAEKYIVPYLFDYNFNENKENYDCTFNAPNKNIGTKNENIQ